MIESISYCLNALADFGGPDSRGKLRAPDMVRTITFGTFSSTYAPSKKICIREVVNADGTAKDSPGIDIKVGELAKQLFMAAHPACVFPKKQIYCNGQPIHANMWLENQRVYIERALAAL